MKNKRRQPGKTKAKNQVSSAQKKTWAEIGPLSESFKTEKNKKFDATEWTWPSRKLQMKVSPGKTDNKLIRLQ